MSFEQFGDALLVSGIVCLAIAALWADIVAGKVHWAKQWNGQNNELRPLRSLFFLFGSENMVSDAI